MEITNPPEAGGYQYTPLADPDHIRLLILQPRSDGIEIKCRIIHDKMINGDVVHYEALSYMWSGPENPKAIQLEGQQHSVRENLWQALSHLRHPTHPRSLWVDAICINQSDTEERNQQVARMSRIYRSALQVLIWLGLADQQTEAAFATLEPINRYSLVEFDTQAYRNVRHLLSKQYWSRLWIVQELYHATDIVIYCGHLQLEWPSLHHVGITIRINQSIGEFDYSDKNSVDALRKSIYDCMAFPLCLNETRRCRRSEDRNTVVEKDPPSLFDLCIKHGQAECEDPRDKVYGLQSMAQTCCREAVPIDYSLSLPDISAMVVSHHISMHTPQDITQYRWRENLVGSLEKFYSALSVTSKNYPSLDGDCTPRPEGNRTLQLQHSLPDHTSVSVLGAFSSRITHVWSLQDESDDTVVDRLFYSPTMSYDTVFKMQRIQNRLLRFQSSGILQIIADHLDLVVQFPEPLSSCLIPQEAASNDFPQQTSTSETKPGELSAYCLRCILSIAKTIVALSLLEDVVLGLTKDGLYFVPAASQVGDAILAFTGSQAYAICRQTSGSSSKHEVFGRCMFLTNDSKTAPMEVSNPGIYVEFLPSTLQLLTLASSNPRPTLTMRLFNRWLNSTRSEPSPS
ncbi:hypothetical protein IFR05_002501 [Cadophora sp. M221]|nr:hypothetical protein IFR05_002501 [Cadophora sp. M221]